MISPVPTTAPTRALEIGDFLASAPDFSEPDRTAADAPTPAGVGTQYAMAGPSLVFADTIHAAADRAPPSPKFWETVRKQLMETAAAAPAATREQIVWNKSDQIAASEEFRKNVGLKLWLAHITAEVLDDVAKAGTAPAGPAVAPAAAQPAWQEQVKKDLEAKLSGAADPAEAFNSALQSLVQAHLDRADYIAALTAIAPQMRVQYVKEQVAALMQKYPPAAEAALRVLSANMNATASLEERQRLYQEAGASLFTEEYFSKQYQALAGTATRRDYPANRIGDWLVRVMADAPAEAATVALAAFKNSFQDGWLSTTPKGAVFFQSLSAMAEAADSLGGCQHSTDLAGWLATRLNAQGRPVFRYLLGAAGNDFSVFTQTVADGHGAKLSIALANRLDGQNSALRDQFLTALAGGIGALQRHVDAALKTAASESKYLGFYMQHFVDQNDAQKVGQAAEIYREQDPDSALHIDQATQAARHWVSRADAVWCALSLLSIKDADQLKPGEKALADVLRGLDGSTFTSAAVATRATQQARTREYRFSKPQANVSDTSGIGRFLAHNAPRIAQASTVLAASAAAEVAQTTGTRDMQYIEHFFAEMQKFAPAHGVDQKVVQTVINLTRDFQARATEARQRQASEEEVVAMLENYETAVAQALNLPKEHLIPVPDHGVERGHYWSFIARYSGILAKSGAELTYGIKLGSMAQGVATVAAKLAPATMLGRALLGLNALTFVVNALSSGQRLAEGRAKPSDELFGTGNGVLAVTTSWALYSALNGVNLARTLPAPYLKLLIRTNALSIMAVALGGFALAAQDINTGRSADIWSTDLMIGFGATGVAAWTAGLIAPPWAIASGLVLAAGVLYRIAYAESDAHVARTRFDAHNVPQLVQTLAKQHRLSIEQARALLNQNSNGVSPMVALNAVARYCGIGHDQLMDYVRGLDPEKLTPEKLTQLVDICKELLYEQDNVNAIREQDPSDDLAGQLRPAPVGPMASITMGFDPTIKMIPASPARSIVGFLNRVDAAGLPPFPGGSSRRR